MRRLHGVSASRFPATSASRMVSANMDHPGHYTRLGIDRSASTAEIKAAYRAKALECHPDTVTNPQDKTRSEVQFRLVSESYRVLADPQLRAKYDEQTAVVKPVPATKVRASAPRQSHVTSAPFVRRDADAVFRDAFDGKTLASILFEARLRRSKGTTVYKQTGSPNGAAEMVLEDMIARRAERLAEQYGPEVMRHTTIHRYKPKGKPPAGLHIPFRPFAGASVPDGCTAETELPRYAPEAQPDVGDVDLSNPSPGRASTWWQSTVDPTERALGKLQEIGAAAQGKLYCEGQLYSYHRPY